MRKSHYFIGLGNHPRWLFGISEPPQRFLVWSYLCQWFCMNSWFDMFDISILTTVKVKRWKCVIHDPTSWRLVCENCRRSLQIRCRDESMSIDLTWIDLHPHRLCGQRHIMAWQFPPVLNFWYLLQHRNLAIPHNPPWQNCIIVHFNLITNQHWNFGISGNINSHAWPTFLIYSSCQEYIETRTFPENCAAEDTAGSLKQCHGGRPYFCCQLGNRLRQRVLCLQWLGLEHGQRKVLAALQSMLYRQNWLCLQPVMDVSIQKVPRNSLHGSTNQSSFQILLFIHVSGLIKVW